MVESWRESTPKCCSMALTIPLTESPSTHVCVRTCVRACVCAHTHTHYVQEINNLKDSGSP